MSSESTVVTSDLFAYIAAHTMPEPAAITERKAAAEAAGIPPIWIGPEQAAMMRTLLALAGARRILEVGALAGTTAAQLALDLDAGGRVDTVELDPMHAAFSEATAAALGVADRVRVLVGRGQDVLPALEAGAYDAVFLDADKSGYGDYLEESARLLRPGGMLLVDNAFAFGLLLDEDEDDSEVVAVRAFNDRLAADPRFEGTILPIGDGLWICRLLA